MPLEMEGHSHVARSHTLTDVDMVPRLHVNLRGKVRSKLFLVHELILSFGLIENRILHSART